MLLEETLAVLSLGEALRGIMGILTTGPAVKKPHLRVPPQRPHLLQHHLQHRIQKSDASRYNENPEPERSGRTSEELQGNPLHKPTETENKNINEGREEVQSDLLHDLPDWLQEFSENLVHERNPSRAWISRHCQFSSWITNGVASKSGTGFRSGQCLYALSEGPKLWYLLED